MTIKPRVVKDVKPTYHQFRKYQWENIDRTGFSSGNSSVNGVPLFKGEKPNAVYFEPRRNRYMKDVWHCGSIATSLAVTRQIAGFEDVNYIEMKGLWIMVSHDSRGQPTDLPGQGSDKRDKVTGKFVD